MKHVCGVYKWLLLISHTNSTTFKLDCNQNELQSILLSPHVLPAVSGADTSDQHAVAAQFSSLARRLWPALLRLAAAGDAVAWQLFGALMDQIVHWLGR